MSDKKIEVNGKTIEIKINRTGANGNIAKYRSNILHWLSRIGITSDYVSIEHNSYNYEEPYAKVKWVVNGEEFEYTCKSQETNTKNMACLSQLVHQEVLFIERGIKTFGMVMNQFRLGYIEGKPSARKIMGIPEDVNDLEYIRFVYKKKAKELHPDNGGSTEKFQELQEAMRELVE